MVNDLLVSKASAIAAAPSSPIRFTTEDNITYMSAPSPIQHHTLKMQQSLLDARAHTVYTIAQDLQKCLPSRLRVVNDLLVRKASAIAAAPSFSIPLPTPNHITYMRAPSPIQHHTLKMRQSLLDA